MDQRVLAHQLRQLWQTTTLNASESVLRALILRHLRKPTKSIMDRDKIVFLLMQYFALNAPPRIYHKQIDLPDAAQIMQLVLAEMRGGGPFRERISRARKTCGGRVETAVSEGIHGAKRQPGL